MADTMSVALVGALILTLTFVPVMCSYWFKKGVRERRNGAFEWIKEKYGEELTWCLDHPKTTMIVATLIFGATLLLVPFIGGSYAHLDEGALWVRATARTISYEGQASSRRRFARDREVSPGDGSRLRTGPSGRRHRSWFLVQFYVELKPYNDLRGQGVPLNKPALIAELRSNSTYPA
jgi:cobalt-zinc-cadmium resistance protein CzcA